MDVSAEKNLKAQIDGDLKDKFDALCERKRISLKDAIEGLIRSVLSQDDVGQSALLGQMELRSDVVGVIMKRLAETAGPRIDDRHRKTR